MCPCTIYKICSSKIAPFFEASMDAVFMFGYCFSHPIRTSVNGRKLYVGLDILLGDVSYEILGTRRSQEQERNKNTNVC